MGYKMLKNKKYHIPMERLIEAKNNAQKEEELIRKIDSMSNEEYDAYIKAELEKSDLEIEQGKFISSEEFWKQFNADEKEYTKEKKNYENWKELTQLYRKGTVIRHTI